MTRFPNGIARRNLLRGAGLLAAGTAVPALLAACGKDSAPQPATGASGKLKPVKLGWWGGTCEAPLYVAYEKGFFAREGLQVELVNLGQDAAKDAIASGKVSGAPGITFEWLKPIEQGADIRVTGGLHGGCLRLVAGAKTGITSLDGLRGKTIGTDKIGGSAHSLFSVVLAAAGIDPQKDVTWVGYPAAQLETAIDKGDVVAVAASDPHPFLIVSDGKGVEISSNLTGAYKEHFCCAIGLNGKLVRDEPATAAAVTKAWLSASRWIGGHVPEAGQLEAEKKYVPVEAAVAAKLLATYFWDGSVDKLKANIQQYAQEFSRTGILDKSTDPNQLAETAFADVTGGDAGLDASTPGQSPAAGAPAASQSPSAGASASASASAVALGLGRQTYRLTTAQRAELERYAMFGHAHAGGAE